MNDIHCKTNQNTQNVSSTGMSTKPMPVQWPVFIYCDAELMILIWIWYGYDTSLFLLLLVDIVACDLYFVSHILLYLIITLILIIHINCINCISVAEYHDIPSLFASHFSSCCCESTLSLCTPISILLICYWTDISSYSCCLPMWLWSIGSSLTWLPRHTDNWLSACYIKSCILTALRTL